MKMGRENNGESGAHGMDWKISAGSLLKSRNCEVRSGFINKFELLNFFFFN